MKKKTLLSVAAVLVTIFLTSNVYAKTWRVNNKSNYDGSALFGDNYGGTAGFPVFKELQQAHDFGSVQSGDTIQVEASLDPYAPASLAKQLTIVGEGFFLSENVNVSISGIDSKIYRIDFQPGAEFSKVMGMTFFGTGYAVGYPYINTDNITISRCWIQQGVFIGSGVSTANVVDNFFPATGVTNAITGGGYGYIPPTDLIFNNNICQKTLLWSTDINTPWEILQCNNNVFDGPPNTQNLQFLTSDFKNNILKSVNAGVNINNGTNTNLEYNVGTLATQFGTANNNLVVPDMTTIFVGPSGQSTDGKYQLKPGSPASGNGSDGTDRGAFGGAVVSKHYTLSGLAPIPVIYEVSTPGPTSTDLPVTIKARTIK